MTKALFWKISLTLCVGILAVGLAAARADEDPILAWTKVTPKERSISWKEVPAPVKVTMLEAAGGRKIQEVEEITMGARKIYEAEWQEGDREVEIQVAADGRLISKLYEKEISINDVPMPARKKILEKAAGKKIVEVEEITMGDRTIYEAGWIENGKEIEIQVDAAGNLLGQTAEEGDDDGDETGDR
jgi:uncharacterized membrane protein YkoI